MYLPRKLLLLVLGIAIQLQGTNFTLVANAASNPDQGESRSLIVEQFEHGLMMRSPSDLLNVTVVFSDGEALQLSTIGLPDNPVTDIPPTGLFDPQSVFGAIWAGVPEIRGKLGWAIETEQVYNVQVGAAAGTNYYTFPDSRRLSLSFFGYNEATFSLPLTSGQMVDAVYGTGSFASNSELILKPWTRRINFAPGAVSGSVTGYLAGPTSFVLNARAGQHMTISIDYQHSKSKFQGQDGSPRNDGGFNGTISTPNGQQSSASVGSPGVLYDGILPASGDYSVQISYRNPDSCCPGAFYIMTVTII